MILLYVEGLNYFVAQLAIVELGLLKHFGIIILGILINNIPKPMHRFYQFKSYVLLLCSLVFSTTAIAQPDFWLRQSFSDGPFTSHSFHAAFAVEDGYYLAGEFWKDIIFDQFSAAIPEGEDTQDSFVLQTDNEGNSINFWHISGNGYERITDIAVTPTGSIWLSGFFANTLVYDNLELSAEGFYDAFVLHIGVDGSLINSFQFSGVNPGDALNIDRMELDAAGDLWLLANFAGAVSVGDTIYNAGFSQDGLVLEMAPNGEILLAHHYESVGSGEEDFLYLNDLAIDQEGRVLVGGIITGEIAINGEPVQGDLSLNTGFVQRWKTLDSDLFQTFSGGSNEVRSITVTEDQIVLGIQFQQSVDVFEETIQGSGSFADMVVVALDSDGELIWFRAFIKGEAQPTGGVYPIDIDHFENRIFMGGFFDGVVSSQGQEVMEADGQQAYLMEFKSNGDLTAVETFSSSAYSRIDAIEASAYGLCFTGEFASDLFFNGESLSEINSTLFYGVLENETVSSTNEAVEATVAIYPNPTHDLWRIQLETSPLNEVSFRLYNSLGQEVDAIALNSRSTNYAATQLAEGLYYFEIRSAGVILEAGQLLKL